MRAHGFYTRTLVDIAFDGTIRVRRYLCCCCKRTVSLLPEFALPYLRFVSVEKIVAHYKEPESSASFFSNAKRPAPRVFSQTVFASKRKTAPCDIKSCSDQDILETLMVLIGTSRTTGFSISKLIVTAGLAFESEQFSRID